MAQIRYHLRASKRDAERIFAGLERALEDEAWPLSIFEVDEKAGIFEVSAYVDQSEIEAADRLASLLPDELSNLRFAAEPVPDVDWVTKSLEGLKPVRAGRVLVHGSHDRDKRCVGDIAIEIEAGLAFGTGHHGTTAGCLQVLADVLRRERPQNALDLGTGSAVLAIAIARMAPIPVLATDIDPVATEVAISNARINGVASQVSCVTATGFHHPAFAALGPFDLIVANILARPLMRLAPEMARHVAPGGSLVLSGILDSQRNAVIAAYVGQHFRHVRTLHREGWVAIHLKR